MQIVSKLLLFGVLLAATSCLNQGKGKKIPGLNGPKLNIQNGKIVLSVEFTKIDWDLGVTLPLPKLKNSSVTIGPTMRSDGTFGGTMLKVAFDLKDVESDVFESVPSQTLPDGRQFPFLIDGELPAIAIHVPGAKNTTFYASKKVFGFFIPLHISDKLPVDFSYRIRVNGKNYGIVSIMHNNEFGEGSGVIVLLSLKDIQRSKGLKKIMRLSKRNKNLIY